MPFFLSLINGITADGRLNRERSRNMEIKIKSLVRRQMVYGFEEQKNGAGRSSGLRWCAWRGAMLLRLVGLKRPALAPAWRWKTG